MKNRVIVKDEFFAMLSEEIVKSSSGRQLILMGDINGRTGRKTGDPVVGNFGEDIVKDNGERLIELYTQTSLKIWNGPLILKMYINIHGNKKKNLKTIIGYTITKQTLKLKHI
jgi:hypothetical protein